MFFISDNDKEFMDETTEFQTNVETLLEDCASDQSDVEEDN